MLSTYWFFVGIENGAATIDRTHLVAIQAKGRNQQQTLDF
jgi:hypothetical protein